MASHLRLSLVVGVLVVTAGCAGSLVEVTASPATIPDSALTLTEYRHQNTTQVPISYPMGMGGLSQAFTVQTWLSAYAPETMEETLAVLVVYSSPDVEVAGASLNPLAQLSNRELTRFVLEQVAVAQVLGGVSGASGLREVGARNLTVLGSTAELVSYAGVAEVERQNVSVTINVVSVRHGSDVIVAVGVHQAEESATRTQAALARTIEHEG